MHIPQLGVQVNFLLLQVMAMEILTKRGKEKFAHNRFLYVFDKTSKTDNELKYWRCEQKKLLQSKASYESWRGGERTEQPLAQSLCCTSRGCICEN